MAKAPTPGLGTLAAAALLLGLLAPMGFARAVPAPPFPLPLKNDDGSVVMGRMFGDERLSWVEDLSGFALAFESATGSWNYAREGADGRLVPTALRAGRADPVAAGLAPHLRPGREWARAALASRRASFEAAARARSWIKKDPTPGARSIRNLVILVKFSDQNARFQPADFEPVFNGATGSVREFYSEISYGQFDLTSTIVPWVPLPNPASYYAYNDYVPYGRPDRMLRDAVTYLSEQGFDFTQFDSDGDGYVDAVDIIHSGEAYETTGNRDYIHSHYAPFDGFYYHSPITHDGLRFTGYHTEAEYGPSGYEITQIGVICHETAHFFGAPDLYDYGYDSAGLGMWSLMAAGAWGGNDGSRPTHPDAYSRTVLGFITPEVLSADQAGVRLSPVEVGPQVVRLDLNMPQNQYFLLEDRQRLSYDQSLPGAGLLIYHVDENQMDEDDQNHYLVDLEQADGRRDLNKNAYARGDAYDPYPTATKNAFSPSTSPSSQPYPNVISQPLVPATIWVTDITRDGQDVSFSLAFHEATAQGKPCADASECVTGYCADGVCCDRACGGTCDVCSVAAGAEEDGTCLLVDGLPCDDKKGCTVEDVCVSGVCKGTTKLCPPADACNEAGVCQSADGTCLIQPKPDDTGCDDGDPCTTRDVCKQGVCTGESPVVCAALDACHLPGVCDRETGTCSDPEAEDGTACGERSICQAGVCTERPPEPDAGSLVNPPAQGCGSCGSAGAAGSWPLLGSLLAAYALFRRRAFRA